MTVRVTFAFLFCFRIICSHSWTSNVFTRDPLFAKGFVDRIVAEASEEAVVSFFVGDVMTEAAHSVSNGSLLAGEKGRLLSRDVVLVKGCR